MMLHRGSCISPAGWPGTPSATPSSALKATTAAPSLNSASPAILALIASGTLTVLSRPSTATGSVGEISAPNTSAQAKDTSKPSRPAASHRPVLQTAIEMTTPMLAIRPIAHFWPFSVTRSTCSAPANSRKARMPFMMAL